MDVQDTVGSQRGILVAALNYVERGWNPIRVPHMSKNPGRSGWQNEMTTIDQVERDFGDAASPMNIGLLLGSPSGNLVDVDLDSPEAVALADAFLPATNFVFGRKSKPRSHRLYTVDGDLPKTERFTAPAGAVGVSAAVLVEVRSTGAQTVVPPSTHPTGEYIAWDCDGQAARVTADDLVTGVRKLAGAALFARCWVPGIRHQVSLALAGTLLRSGWDAGQAREFVTAIVKACNDEEPANRLTAVDDTYAAFARGESVTGIASLENLLGEVVVRKLVEWLGLRQDQELMLASDDTRPNLTDLGNAQRLIARHGSALRYSEEWGKWLYWDGKRWQTDTSREVVRRAFDTVEYMHEEAAALTDDAKRRELRQHALNSEAQYRINAMIQLARALPGVPVETSDLDQRPFLLTVENGTIDLKSGALEPHKREDLITKLVPVVYDPAAQAPKWMSFLNRIMDGNENLISFLQRAVGYSLTGVVSERALFILHGSGANGKTMFLQTIATLLGEYAMATPIETFMLKRDGAVPNDIARLRGSRFAHASEADQGKRLSEAIIKQLTGGDMVTARFMHKDFFEFEPTFKLWMGTNHKPEVVGTDNAIWDRIKLIPFTVTIPESERVPRHVLRQELGSELSGILNWAIEGCLAWQQQELGVPEEVRLATSEYRGEMDVVAQWMTDCCDQTPAGRTSLADLHDSYLNWCYGNGEAPLAKKQFSQRMAERGFTKRRSGSAGSTEWHGIRLIQDFERLKGLKDAEGDPVLALSNEDLVLNP